MIKDIIENNELAQAGGKEISVLKRYFPQCFTSDGKFDIEAFKASLPEDTDITDETSGFTFLGKNYARMLTNMDTTTIIRPDEEHNSLPENKDSKNVYISGDNLDALQHLVKSYYGRVKVIYIAVIAPAIYTAANTPSHPARRRPSACCGSAHSTAARHSTTTAARLRTGMGRSRQPKTPS